jgi:hypothetical protein
MGPEVMQYKPEEELSAKEFYEGCGKAFIYFCALFAFIGWWAWPALRGDAATQVMNEGVSVTNVDNVSITSMLQTRMDKPFIQPAMGTTTITTFGISTTQWVSVASPWQATRNGLIQVGQASLYRMGTQPWGQVQLCVHSNDINSFSPSVTTLACSNLVTCNLIGTPNNTQRMQTFTLTAALPISTGVVYWTALHFTTFNTTASQKIAVGIGTGSNINTGKIMYKGITTLVWSEYGLATSRQIRHTFFGQP